MDFDPDAFLAQSAPATDPGSASQAASNFDPDAFLEQKKSSEQDALQAKYGTLPQQAIGYTEALAKGLLSRPVVAGAEALATHAGIPGLSPEAQAGREAANPLGSGVLEGAGLILPAVATGGVSAAARAGLEVPEAASLASKALGYSQASLLSKAGEAGASALGLGAEGASAINKIGSSVVSGAIENSLFSAGDVGSKIINGENPAEAVETALPYIGLSALAGGVLGGGITAVPELWKATHGANTGGILRAITNRLGGSETDALSDPVSRALETVGIEPKPEIVASMSSDPAIQRMAKALEQSDASKSGIAYQESLKDFHEQAANSIASTLGKTPEEIKNLKPASKYEAGKSIGDTLADEYQERLDPTIKEFDDLKLKYKDAPLVPDEKVPGELNPSRPYELSPQSRVIPGTASQISDKLGELASNEGWIGGDETINRELSRVMKVLPQKKTLGELTNLISQVGNNTKSTLPFGMQTPLSRAGSLIKKVLRDAEDEIAIKNLGEKGQELVQRFRAAQDAYKSQAALKEALNDRLRVGGSISGFSKGLREMARTDGESVLKRLSGTSDANLLEFLNQNFPKTAQALKEYHVNSLLETAASKAKAGQAISVEGLQKAIEKMSPEMRNFAVPKELSDKLDGMSILQDQMNRVPHNFSNTARATGVMNKYGLGTAMGMVSMLTGHGAIANIAAGQLAHTLSNSAPDAIRLSLLKFLGSNKPINSTAFKAMADFIQSSMRGENLTAQAIKSIFKAGTQVIPRSMIPDEESRKKLEKNLQKVNSGETKGGGSKGVGHYLQNHAVAANATATKAARLLSQMKPVPIQNNPLDKPTPIDKNKQAQYHRALDIAQQPLMVLQYAKEGSLTPHDVSVLNTLYPNLHNKISESAYVQMSKALSEGHTIPYKQKLSLSLLMGRPLDSTMTQSAMQTIIMANAPKGKPQQAPQSPKKPNQATANSMQKLDKSYATPSQARAAERSAS